MEFVGAFFILVAAGLRLASANLDSSRSTGAVTSPAKTPARFSVPPGAVVIMVAAAGVFIFAANVGQP